MFSLNPAFSSQPALWTEGCRGGANDSYPAPKNHMSRLGESLLTPLNICGKDWQLLQSESGNGALYKISLVSKKGLLVIAILFALIPGTIGSLIKTVSNSPLKKDECYRMWELQTSPSLQSQCHQLGLYDFNRDETQITTNIVNFIKRYSDSEFPMPSSIFVSKEGHAHSFSRTIALNMGSFGISRPNGNSFLQNLVNSFRPENLQTLDLREIKLLEDLLLGIKSGTDEDYRRLHEHLSYCTEIVFTIHWSPDPSWHFGRRLDLRIFY